MPWRFGCWKRRAGSARRPPRWPRLAEAIAPSTESRLPQAAPPPPHLVEDFLAEVASEGADERAVLNRKLGDALAKAGRGGEAALAYMAATEGATVAEALELKRRATLQLLISGRVDEGLAALQSVLGTLGMALPLSPRRSLAWLILHRAWLRLRGFGFQRRDTSQLSAEQLTRIDLCWSVASGLTRRSRAGGLLLALKAGDPYRVAQLPGPGGDARGLHAHAAGRRSSG